MNLQKFLRNNTLDDLSTNYSIKIKTHKDYPNLHLFKYDMINSPFSEDIVRESRGIILDKDNNWEIISYPYNKFFNHGEKHAADINWTTSKVYNKLDGSLITLYWYDSKWHVSTSGMPDAAGTLNNNNSNTNNSNLVTFNDIFWKTWNELGYELPEDTTKCYIFELTTPHNVIIVPQTESNITLHGIRCLKTLTEQEISCIYGWNIVQNYNFETLTEAVNHGKQLDPSKQEGYVVCDDNFNRIKIKGILYVQLHHIGTKSDKNIKLDLIKIIQINEGEEFIESFPTLKDQYEELKQQYDDMVLDIVKETENLKEYKIGKELAMEINDKWYRGCIFDSKRKSFTNLNDFVKLWLSETKPQNILDNIK